VIAGKGASILSATLFNLDNNGQLKAIRIKNPSIFKEIIVHHKQKNILGKQQEDFLIY
jgi:hypothetical protein